MSRCCGCLKSKQESEDESEIPLAILNNGELMPVLGLGTYQVTDPKELEIALEEALQVGYRHFDTAFMYKNESVIGSVLKRWIDNEKIAREDLFVTTKLPPNGMHPSKVAHFLKKSLNNLQLAYVDLYLIHWPFGVPYIDDDTSLPVKDDGTSKIDPETDLVAIWNEMEEQVYADLTKSIGVSNFNSKQIKKIVKSARIKPANNQIEASVYCQKKEIRATCAKYGISVCAYSPLGSTGSSEYYKKMGVNFPSWGMLQDPVILEIAEAHQKTAAQICLKFLLQQSLIVIPKSVSPERINENFEVFDFELTATDMKDLEALDRGDEGRVWFRTLQGFDAHPEWPFDNNV